MLEKAREKIEAKWPELEIAGTYSPPFAALGEMDHDEINERVRAARADLLFVCFGCPKQEKWLAMNLASVGVPVGNHGHVTIGASRWR